MPAPGSRLPAILLLLTLLATPAARGQDGDVRFTVDQFGVGSTWRPGEYVGIRLLVSKSAASGLPDAIDVWVQWEIPNADGDIAEYGRRITLSRDAATPVWLYAPLPPDTTSQTVWTVRILEYVDGRRGRDLGGGRLLPPAPGAVPASMSMLGVVGSAQMGLSQYRLPSGPNGRVFTAHEETRIVAGLRAEELPDRWEGLRAFEAIAWADAEPQDLTSATGEALREYVRRGGHLVIVLPEDTNPWGLGEVARTELDDLLPSEAPRVDPDEPLDVLMPVFAKADGLRSDVRARFGLRVFRTLDGSFDALAAPWEPHIALTDGRVIVAQRLFGHGRITLVGVDLTNGSLNSLLLSNGVLSGLPQADVFWNRILGRRADTPLQGEIAIIADADRLSRQGREQLIGTGQLVRDQINMSGEATRGLAMAVLLFIAYWLLAGPGGFYLLKQRRLQRHAWVVFAGAAGVFTALAWGGVSVIRESDVEAQHLTFLDHVARPPGATADESDPQLQRGVAWMSLYLPGYGERVLGIDSEPAQGVLVPAQRDLLASWQPPGVAVQKFPNIDRYPVDVHRDPDDFPVPSRSTATQLAAHWLGGVDPEWGDMIRLDAEDPLRIEVDAGGIERLTGGIINNLPGTLENPTIIWIQNNRVPDRRYGRADAAERAWIAGAKSGHLLNNGRMWRLAGGAWPAGDTLRPGGDDRGGVLDIQLEQRYYREFAGDRGLPGVGGSALSTGQAEKFLEMLSFFNQLVPPKYLRDPGRQGEDTMVAQRLLGRELDLSPWFTRPCVIVIGYLRDSECPIPLRVDGRPVRSTGTTVVRWILPLEIVPDIAFSFPPDPDADDGSFSAR